jgi:AsmA protein
MQASRRRKRSLPPILVGAALILVLAVAAGIMATSALNPGRLRDALQASVRRSTGRALTIAGDVHLRLGLSPQIVVDDIALANLPGGSRPQMVTARQLRAQLALLPLLAGDAVISSIDIDQPDILLERTQDGTPNWQFTPEHRALYQSHAGSGGGGGGSHRVEIRSIEMEGGQIAWRPDRGPAITLSIGTLTVFAASMDTPMALSFTGTAGGAPLTITASSGSLGRLAGAAVGALAGSWPLTVDLATQGATLHLEGGVNHPEQMRSYQFRLTAHAATLDPLNALLPTPALPPVSEVNATALLSDGSQGEIRTSQVSVHVGASDLARWVPGLTIKQAVLSAPGPGQLMQLNVDGSYLNQPLRFAAAAMQPDLVAGAVPLQLTANASAAGANLSAHGTVPSSLATTGLDLAVTLRAPDLSSLSPLVGRRLPAAHDLTLQAQLGDAGVKLRGIAVRNLAVTSSLGDVTGEVTVDWAPRPAIEGTLVSRTLDLDALLRGGPGLALPATWPVPAEDGTQVAMPSGETPPAAASPGSDQAVPATAALFGGDLPLPLLRNADANLTLSATDVTLGGAHYRDLDAQLQLAGGKLALNPFRAQAPEGAIVGGISIDASSDQPPVAVSLRSPSISAAAVADALGYPGGATGTMQVDAQLSGVGRNLPALEASLDGHVGLAMVNGQVNDSLVQGLIGPALETAGVSAASLGSSQVGCLAIRADFAAGMGRIQTLAVDMTRLSLDGSGTLDLHNRTADLHLRPQLRLGSTAIAAPVSLRGAFGEMKASLDPTMGGGRVGLTIGGMSAPTSGCAGRLAAVRNGLGGPLPAAAPAGNPLLTIRKPKDLLKGLFH